MSEFDSQKEHHEAQMAMIDHVAETNPKAAAQWIGAELAAGKFLVVPSVIYADCVKCLRESGVSEEALKNLVESKYLPAK